jgi:hypothetical protein
MKTLFILCLILSVSAFAKSAMDFNQALNDDVTRDIRKDDDKFKKESFRRPASVEIDTENVIEETPKLDKNVRQLGPNKW